MSVPSSIFLLPIDNNQLNKSILLVSVPSSPNDEGGMRRPQFCIRLTGYIRNLLESNGFTESNFGLSEYIDSTGRTLPMYIT